MKQWVLLSSVLEDYLHRKKKSKLQKEREKEATAVERIINNRLVVVLLLELLKSPSTANCHRRAVDLVFVS